MDKISLHDTHSQQPKTNQRRRGALHELAELHGPNEQLGSPDPLKSLLTVAA